MPTPLPTLGLLTMCRRCASKTLITTHSVTTSPPTIILDAEQLLHVLIGNRVCLRVGQSEICRGLLMCEIKTCLDCVQLAPNDLNVVIPLDAVASFLRNQLLWYGTGLSKGALLPLVSPNFLLLVTSIGEARLLSYHRGIRLY